nr:AT4G36440-like protein [Ipomoea batatas]
MTLALHALGSNGLIPLRLSLLVTRTIVELAIPCDKPGKRVFEGFTVGFHLRKWEISCFYVPPSLLSGVALARTTQSGSMQRETKVYTGKIGICSSGLDSKWPNGNVECEIIIANYILTCDFQRRLMRLRMIRKELLNANDKVMIPSYNLFTFYFCRLYLWVLFDGLIQLLTILLFFIDLQF